MIDEKRFEFLRKEITEATEHLSRVKKAISFYSGRHEILDQLHDIACSVLQDDEPWINHRMARGVLETRLEDSDRVSGFARIEEATMLCENVLSNYLNMLEPMSAREAYKDSLDRLRYSYVVAGQELGEKEALGLEPRRVEPAAVTPMAVPCEPSGLTLEALNKQIRTLSGVELTQKEAEGLKEACLKNYPEIELLMEPRTQPSREELLSVIETLRDALRQFDDGFYKCNCPGDDCEGTCLKSSIDVGLAEANRILN
jgi:hypothetical protein